MNQMILIQMNMVLMKVQKNKMTSQSNNNFFDPISTLVGLLYLSAAFMLFLILSELIFIINNL